MEKSRFDDKLDPWRPDEAEGAVDAEKLALNEKMLDDLDDVLLAMESGGARFSEALQVSDSDEVKELAEYFVWHGCISRKLVCYLYLQNEGAVDGFSGSYNYFREIIHGTLLNRYGWDADRVAWAFGEYDRHMQDWLNQALMDSAPGQEPAGELVSVNGFSGSDLFAAPETVRRLVEGVRLLSATCDREYDPRPCIDTGKLRNGYFSEDASPMGQDIRCWAEIIRRSCSATGRRELASI